MFFKQSADNEDNYIVVDDNESLDQYDLDLILINKFGTRSSPANEEQKY